MIAACAVARQSWRRADSKPCTLGPFETADAGGEGDIPLGAAATQEPDSANPRSDAAAGHSQPRCARADRRGAPRRLRAAGLPRLRTRAVSAARSLPGL